MNGWLLGDLLKLLGGTQQPGQTKVTMPLLFQQVKKKKKPLAQSAKPGIGLPSLGRGLGGGLMLLLAWVSVAVSN